MKESVVVADIAPIEAPLFDKSIFTTAKYVTVGVDGIVKLHYDEPYYYRSKPRQWVRGTEIGYVEFDEGVDVMDAVNKSVIKLTSHDIDIKETLSSSGLYKKVVLRNNHMPPTLMEGRHYRAIYLDEQNGEIEVPSTYKFATVQDDGTLKIFTEKPLYQTTGEWTGKGEKVIAKAIWNENYSFPIYTSSLIKKLFGVSYISDITKNMVVGWNVDTLAVKTLMDEFTVQNPNKLDIEHPTPGAMRLDESTLARTQYIDFDGKPIKIPSHFTWAAVSDDGAICLYHNKPNYVNGKWKGKGATEIGFCRFYDEVNRYDIMDLYWKISNVSAKKFLDYRNHIIRSVYIDNKVLSSLDTLHESKIHIQGDEVNIPDGYSYIAIDANTDMCVFKEEPHLQGDVWKGKGKHQIGVAVWDFNSLDGNPTSMTDAKPKIVKILDEFKYEITDNLDLQSVLDETGKFKYFFAKYNEIDKL